MPQWLTSCMFNINDVLIFAKTDTAFWNKDFYVEFIYRGLAKNYIS